jgi:hypothetical protein
MIGERRVMQEALFYGFTRGVSRRTSLAGLSSRKPTKTVWRRRPSSGQLR